MQFSLFFSSLLVAILALLATPSVAFQLSMMSTPNKQPMPSTTNKSTVDRRDMVTKSLSLGLGIGLLSGITAPKVWAEEGAAAPAKTTIEMPPTPTSFKLNKVYYDDAKQMVSHMKYATFMDRGTPEYENIAKGVKEEMTEFVSYYRRFGNVAGKPSFSNLYTAVNVLAGHYTSYGTKFPVPEKRRKRLLQEYNEIEKNIRKSR